MMDYTNFSAEDFVKDTFFQEWIVEPTPETIDFWTKWQQAHPEKENEIKEAQEIVQILGFRKDVQINQYFLNSWAEIQRRNTTLGPKKNKWQPTQRFYIRKKLALTAIFIGLAVISTLWILFQKVSPDSSNSFQSYTTRYGETGKVWLPDSSLVVLNANTKLQFRAEWKPGLVREVWLDGEAFFDIRRNPLAGIKQAKKPSSPIKFIVHTNKLDVEVLGTRFNVNCRRGKTQVVLNTGSVKLKAKQAGLKDQIMNPGELLELDAYAQTYTRRIVNPKDYSAWKHNKLFCNGTSVTAIAQTLEDRFGVKVQIQRKELAAEKVSGSLPIDNLEECLELLSGIIQAQISRENGVIIIQ
ncbi:MAG: DUF4974 domain-containing protein [Bacteroidia bacterium]|nr:DUF4974 domain-containing protein [Bacteroidia bacterium]